MRRARTTNEHALESWGQCPWMSRHINASVYASRELLRNSRLFRNCKPRMASKRRLDQGSERRECDWSYVCRKAGTSRT